MTAPTGERTDPVDPRLRARLREIQRHQGRRRLRRLQVGLGAAAVGAGGWGLALSPALDVDRVQVRGATTSGADVVEDATGIERKEAMVTLDLDGARTAVEALPWIATATVTRSWPGTVSVAVTERLPLAVVATIDGGWVVVDRDGRMLAVVDEEDFADLARIVGLASQPRPGGALGEEAVAALELAGLLPATVPGVVPVVAVVDGALHVTLPRGSRGGTLVRFGGPDRVADKVDALAALVDGGVLSEDSLPLVIDIRVPDAPVLTRTGG